MGKKLAIKGHETRGKEIIELLEMMGGINDEGYSGTNTWKDEYYFLDNGYIRAYDWCDGIKFTLEEFLDKYPYKIGDKVYTKSNAEGTIIDMFWDGIEVLYQLSSESVNALGYFHRNELKLYKEEVNMEDNKLFGTVSNPVETKSYSYTVGLKDGKVIDNSIDASQFMQLGKIFAVCFNTENYENEVELKLGDYEIVVRDGKTYAVLKKSKYPTTYAECCEVLVGRKPKPNEISFDKMEFCLVDLDNTQNIDFQNPYLSQLNSLFRLRICCDAYWKIYGEEMGLGKPWKPDWDNLSTNHEFIEINKGCFTYSSRVLVFPIAEMRDAFYDNFKDLIEQCKELL